MAPQGGGDAEGRTAWKLFGTLYAPSDAARADEDSYANRALVPINWAVPVNRPAIGQLWGCFPTLDETTLSGVINAPWILKRRPHGPVPGLRTKSSKGRFLRSWSRTSTL